MSREVKMHVPKKRKLHNLESRHYGDTRNPTTFYHRFCFTLHTLNNISTHQTDMEMCDFRMRTMSFSMY